MYMYYKWCIIKVLIYLFCILISDIRGVAYTLFKTTVLVSVYFTLALYSTVFF